MDLIELFDKNINIYNTKPAIIDATQTLTYQQLGELTLRIAGSLVEQGVGEGDVVTIEAQSRLESIALIIGTVRAGAAYCVIPQSYPDYRKEQMRAQIQAKCCLRNTDFANADHMLPLLPASRKPDSLLYIIFTSGSTGEPKAVAIEDKAVAKIVKHRGFYSGEVIGQLAPLEFDASIYEIFGGLLNGLTLRLISKDDSLDFEVMPLLFEEIDTLFLTTRLFNLYVDEFPEQFSKLSLVLTGGERCSIHHLQTAAKYCKVQHVYGPTETTVFATAYEVKGDEQEIPIGRLFDEGAYIIADENQQQVAPGSQGELYLSDSGLMRGYVGDEAASRKVFFYEDHKRFYRTGDIVQVNAEGEIVYVERKDRQVKISGYRIELGEVEKCAYDFGLQKDCLAHYDGKRLYLFVKDQIELEPFRQHLRSRLPEYMIPTVKVVDIIPMNTNGKTDVKVINNGNWNAKDDKNEIIEVVATVLKTGISREQRFLDLGGDSIKAMEIIWQLGSKGYQLDLDMLFSRTIGEIADHVSNG